MSREAPVKSARKRGLPKPTRRSDAAIAGDTRQQLIDAAIRAIDEGGIGNANSSKVARQVGASWGSIQYYFGSWEALLLDALKQMTDRSYELITSTRITGDTVLERLTVYSDLIFSVYGAGRYGTVVQIAEYLLGNPKTQESTLAMTRYAVQRQDPALITLLSQVSPALAGSVPLRNLVQYSLAGLAMSMEVARSLFHDVESSQRHPDERLQRRLLVQSLTMMLEKGGAE